MRDGAWAHFVVEHDLVSRKFVLEVDVHGAVAELVGDGHPRQVVGRGVSASRPALTRAPAIAITALMPTVRNSVLFPDMLDPLTISKRTSGESCTSFLTI